MTTTGTAGSPSPATHRSAPPAAVLRLIGALAVLAVGAIHIQQYAADYYRHVPVIGAMFLLNFISAILIALLLLVPVQRLAERIRPGSGRLAAALPALGGIALAALSIVFLLISESTRLFGFKESGYRTAIYLALLTEALAVLTLSRLPRRHGPAITRTVRPHTAGRLIVPPGTGVVAVLAGAELGRRSLRLTFQERSGGTTPGRRMRGHDR